MLTFIKLYFNFLLACPGLDKETGIIVEFAREGVEHISGSGWLDNHTVNLLSSFLTAIILPEIAKFIWPC